ncbi:MAG: hypothetical protein R3A79_26940 [Nannocystaceae bacterium]
MSRGYRIRWPQPVWHSASEAIESEDGIAMDVGILEILPEAEMVALLREQLAAAGWTKAEDGAMRTTIAGVDVELSADGKTVTAKAKVGRQVSVRSTDKGELEGRLAQQGDKARRELSREVAAKVVGAEAEVREAVQGALQRVYVDALKRKAAAMGEIESVHEGQGEGGELELTIKVKV